MKLSLFLSFSYAIASSHNAISYSSFPSFIIFDKDIDIDLLKYCIKKIL